MGTGYLVDTYGWIGGFAFWGISALIGMIIAASLWNVCPMTHREKH